MTSDPLDELGPRDRGLIELFRHLTSAPSPDELAGEYAAVTMFRAMHGATARLAQSAGAGAHAAPRRPARRRLASRARVGGRLVAAATVVALAGGFAAAGYAQVLPSPLQQLAHQLLGFAGVRNPPGQSGSTGPTVPVASRRTTSGPTSPGSSKSSRPGTTSQSPSPHRSPSAAPSPSRSATVVPVITVSQLTGGHGQSEMLIVSIPLAQSGDVVRLEDLVGGQWRLVHTHRLHRGGKTEFSVVARRISVTYRVVLPATVKHEGAVSPRVTVAARQRQQGGQGRG